MTISLIEKSPKLSKINSNVNTKQLSLAKVNTDATFDKKVFETQNMNRFNYRKNLHTHILIIFINPTMIF